MILLWPKLIDQLYKHNGHMVVPGMVREKWLRLCLHRSLTDCGFQCHFEDRRQGYRFSDEVFYLFLQM